MALIEKLNNIGNAIRSKTGKTDLLTLDEMVIEIGNIETGGGSGGDISEYFGTDVTSNTSGSSNNIIIQILKKCPSVIIDKSVTSLKNAFSYANITTIEAISGTDNVTNMNNMFSNCKSLERLPDFNTSKVTNMDSMFGNCLSLVTIPQFDTSNVTTMRSMFGMSGNSKLVSIPKLNASKIININTFVDLYNGTNVLTDMGGLENLGQSYASTKTANYSNFELNLSKVTNLTHDSLMNVINNLYDLNLTYDVANGGTLYTQKLILGSTNIGKLNSSELELATSKGWTVS